MASTPTVPAAHPEGLVLEDSQGRVRGYVDPFLRHGSPALEDLWVMQGSLCDLKCKHCYTASSPLAGHLEQISFEELRPHLDQAAGLGVGRIYFTGGEVFVNEDVLRGRDRKNREFLRSLERALEIAPVEILTNARLHIRSHFDDLVRLRDRFPGRLLLRITLESPEAAAHDAIRGRGTFQQTVDTIVDLCGLGFKPVITAERPLLSEQSNDGVLAAYRELFASRGVTVEVNLIENVLEMGHQLAEISRHGGQPRPEVFVSTGCFSILNRTPESLMCHFSRCVQKRAGQIRIYPCPVIYDDPRFELGGTLVESLRRVYIAHKNCYDYCLKGKGSTCRTQVL